MICSLLYFTVFSSAFEDIAKRHKPMDRHDDAPFSYGPMIAQSGNSNPE
jgi:hypothetical protein